MEIPTRPRPRILARILEREEPAKIKVGAIILAAGAASRMKGHHKLLAEFDGVPLVRRSVQMVLISGFDHQVIVTGHREKDILAALSQIAIKTVHNEAFATGMASSLRVGLAALADRVDGVMVVLADMPGLAPAHLSAMIAAFKTSGGKAIIRAVVDGKRGNPVILPRATFGAIERLQGDIGARPIIEKSGLEIIDIDIGEAAHIDVDTPEAIIAAGGVLKD